VSHHISKATLDGAGETDFATDPARLLFRELDLDPAGVADFRDFGEALFDAFLGDTAGGEGALGRKAVGDVFDFAGNSL